MGRYAVGVDYGSLSGRAGLVDLDTGKELAASVFAYPHGVMARELPDGTPLPDDWAVQDPQDYLEVLRRTACELAGREINVRLLPIAGAMQRNLDELRAFQEVRFIRKDGN